MIALKPLPGHVLVELRDKYEHVATTEQKYDTRTSGICITVPNWSTMTKWNPDTQEYVTESRPDYLEGKLVFWEEYKDGAVLERDGKKYAFIRIEDLTGYEDVETN